jgi:hypothetical protein
MRADRRQCSPYLIVIRRLRARAEPEADIWQNAKSSLPAEDTANMRNAVTRNLITSSLLPNPHEILQLTLGLASMRARRSLDDDGPRRPPRIFGTDDAQGAVPYCESLDSVSLMIAHYSKSVGTSSL